MKILYVGFKGIHNISNKLVNCIQGDKYFLTNSFDGLKRDIDNLQDDYERVYMFGIDKTLKNSVRIEKCAEKNGQKIYTKMELSEMKHRLKGERIHYSVSERPTYYLCNEAYYYMLKKMKGNTVFIHIPSLKNFTEDLLQQLILAFKENNR